ncbi:hypothetical protein [Roseibium aggregatum]|uniref:Uncharacterized protein n=1 Tax=Roseibium aggregatum TaxID=187304 RepID=A0A939EGG9_9HYPH|nr:hypothetical protein [Roseibium aggregatum]MBN9672037.1 hypothetical protein [Roseibium aggregatum]
MTSKSLCAIFMFALTGILLPSPSIAEHPKAEPVPETGPVTEICLPGDVSALEVCAAFFLDEAGYTICLSDQLTGDSFCRTSSFPRQPDLPGGQHDHRQRLAPVTKEPRFRETFPDEASLGANHCSGLRTGASPAYGGKCRLAFSAQARSGNKHDS